MYISILDKTAIRQDLDAFPVHWCTKIKALLRELENENTSYSRCAAQLYENRPPVS